MAVIGQLAKGTGEALVSVAKGTIAAVDASGKIIGATANTISNTIQTAKEVSKLVLNTVKVVSYPVQALAITAAAVGTVTYKSGNFIGQKLKQAIIGKTEKEENEAFNKKIYKLKGNSGRKILENKVKAQIEANEAIANTKLKKLEIKNVANKIRETLNNKNTLNNNSEKKNITPKSLTKLPDLGKLLAVPNLGIKDSAQKLSSSLPTVENLRKNLSQTKIPNITSFKMPNANLFKKGKSGISI